MWSKLLHYENIKNKTFVKNQKWNCILFKSSLWYADWWQGIQGSIVCGPNIYNGCNDIFLFCVTWTKNENAIVFGIKHHCDLFS